MFFEGIELRYIKNSKKLSSKFLREFPSFITLFNRKQFYKKPLSEVWKIYLECITYDIYNPEIKRMRKDLTFIIRFTGRRWQG